MPGMPLLAKRIGGELCRQDPVRSSRVSRARYTSPIPPAPQRRTDFIGAKLFRLRGVITAANQNHLLRMKKVGCEIAQPGKAPVYDGH
jgi:hypothetical protein